VKKSKSVQICTSTGAILSIEWDISSAKARSPLSDDMAKFRKFAIQYIRQKKKNGETFTPNFHYSHHSASSNPEQIKKEPCVKFSGTCH
jgi:hypothetical protein